MKLVAQPSGKRASVLECGSPLPLSSASNCVRHAPSSPAGTPENSPRFQPWVSAIANGSEPRRGERIPRSIPWFPTGWRLQTRQFLPSLAGLIRLRPLLPPMNRWAIFNRPHGTSGGERARLGRCGWRLANHVRTRGQLTIQSRRERRLAAPGAGALPSLTGTFEALMVALICGCLAPQSVWAADPAPTASNDTLPTFFQTAQPNGMSMRFLSPHPNPLPQEREHQRNRAGNSQPASASTALSSILPLPQEREPMRAGDQKSQPASVFAALPSILPLPGGEGRGEEERNAPSIQSHPEAATRALNHFADANRYWLIAPLNTARRHSAEPAPRRLLPKSIVPPYPTSASHTL